MATWINQAKSLFGSLTDGVMPSNATLIKHTTSVASFNNGREWRKNLQRNGLVVNPDSANLMDIGTVEVVDGERVFTPTPEQLNSMLAFNVRAVVREYLRQRITAERAESGVIAAEDVGKTPAEVREDSRLEADAEVSLEIGDPDNDPES